MTVWYASDLHLGHKLVADLRGFDSVKEHDETIEANWRARVRTGDLAFVLGDASLDYRLIGQLNDWPGLKVLIAGNHDRCHPSWRDYRSYEQRYLSAFSSIQPFARRRIAGREVLLSHFPYAADHTKSPRSMQWRLPDLGGTLIHGHTHSSVRRTSDREIHVGLDAWGLSPVPEADLVPLLPPLEGPGART